MAKTLEKEVLDLFANQNTRLTRKEIGTAIHKKDPSGIIRDLIYFDYLVENDDATLSLTDKHYNDSIRKNKKRPVNYRIVLNKIFTGSFLEYNLGHEIINFIKDESDKRYVYLNPWGERGEDASLSTEYVFHIIESSLNDENGIFELVGVSKINQNAIDHYSKNTSDEIQYSPVFNGHSYYDIFYCGSETGKAHVYTYEATHFYRPTNRRIIIKIGRDSASINDVNGRIEVTLMCNPQHSICYADASGKKTYSSNPNPHNDVEVLLTVLNKYLEEADDSVNINEIDNEQCFSIISGRAKLEVSTSNQIAYFLQRDSHLLYCFLHDFLNINDVTEDEQFEIVREKEENIDLLFKSNNHIVIVENKIDSKINGVSNNPNANGKFESQLSKYYRYVESKYSHVPSRNYFVLAPEYNELTRETLNERYENGNQYVLKSYNDLFNSFINLQYRPNGHQASSEGTFLFSQFKKSIEYLTWSKGKQRERTAYIRLKQRLDELDN